MTMHTPKKILENAVARFSVLLVKDEKQLQTYCRQALGQYQDLAGVQKTIRLMKGGEFALPSDYLDLVIAKDTTGNYLEVEQYYNESGQLVMNVKDDMRFPVFLTYFVNLRNLDFEKGILPDQCIGLIEDYLYTLIAIENDDRVGRVEQLGKMDTSRMQTSQDRYAQKEALELAMKDRREILPFFSVHPWGS